MGLYRFHQVPPLKTMHIKTNFQEKIEGRKEAVNRLKTVHEMYLVCVHYSYLYTYDVYGPVRNTFVASGMGLGSGNRDFFGPVKWHRAYRQLPFGAQKCLLYKSPRLTLKGYLRSAPSASTPLNQPPLILHL